MPDFSRREQIAWAAGFFDTDGCVSHHTVEFVLVELLPHLIVKKERAMEALHMLAR